MFVKAGEGRSDDLDVGTGFNQKKTFTDDEEGDSNTPAGACVVTVYCIIIVHCKT